MDELLRFKSANKQATLDINQALKQSKELETLNKVNINKEDQQKKELTSDDILIPREMAYQIGEKKHETFRELDKKTDFQIFQNSIDAKQAKEANQLKAQQAQETLLYKYDDTYNSDILAPIFSTDPAQHLNRVSRAIKADKAYDYSSNVSIPTELKHSNQMVDLKHQQANSKALAINNFIKKQINDEFQYIKDNYKDYAVAYAKEYNRIGIIGDEALQEAYAKAYEITTNNYAEMTQTSGPLDNIIRGVVHTTDTWASMGASLSASLREGTLTFKDAPILEKFLESAFNYKSYNKYEAFGTASVIQDNLKDTLRLLPVANAISTFAESLPEMIELGIMGSGFAKGWNKTVLDARNALIAEKTLTKNMSKHLDRQIRLADFKGNTQLKERLESLKLHLANPSAKTLTKDEFASIAGAVASTFNKVSFFKGLKNAGPLPFTLLAVEWAKRGVDLYKDKPADYQLTLYDAMTPLIHLFVDYAGIIGMLGAKNVFVGARNSLYNKQEIARLSAKETLTKVEKDTLDFLKQTNKTKIGDGLRSSLLGGFAVEGFGEMIQTHLEQQVQSGFTLPSFTDMLFNEYNLSSLREKQEDMYRTGMLGGLGGGLAGGASHIVGNTFRKADESISEHFSNKEKQESEEVLKDMPQAAEFNNDYYQQYIADTFKSQFKRLNIFDDKSNSANNESASEFAKKQEEILEEGKKLEQIIREEEKKTNNYDIVLKTNNNERIEQLEHSSNILAKEIKDGDELSKELLDKKIEEKEQIDSLIKAYQDLDELNTSSMLSTSLLAKVNNDLSSEVKERQIKLLIDIANSKNKEERDKAITAFLEEIDIDTDTITQTIKDFIANNKAKQTSSHIGTLTQNNNIQEVKEKTNDSRNKFNGSQKTSFNNNEDNTISETENIEENENKPTESKNVEDTNKETTIEEQNIVEVNALDSKNKKAIKDYLMSLDPEVSAFLLLEDHTKTSSRQKIANKAFEEYKKSKALVRIPIEDLDEDSNARLTDAKTNDKDKIIHTRKEEAIMVPIRYYNPATKRTESIANKDSKTGDLQSSLRTLANIRSNNFSDKINKLIHDIQQGDIDEARKTKIENEVNSIQKEFMSVLNSVKSKALFIQKILALTTNKKLQNILKRSLNNTNKELDRVHKDIKRLNDIINENKNIIDKTIKEEYDNKDIDGETALLQSLTNTTSKMFSSIRTKINNYLKLDGYKRNAERTKIRKILYHLRQIFNKMTDFFNSKEYQDLYNETKAILDTHKDFFNIPTDKEYYLNFNRNGVNTSIGINGLYHSMFKETFSTLLYDFYGVKPEVSSKEVLLDYLIRLGLNRESFKSQYVSMFEPLLNKIKINIGKLDKTEHSNRNMQQGTQSIFNKEFTLFDLLVPNVDSINKIFTRNEINKILENINNKKTISTTDTALSERDTTILNDNLEVFKDRISKLVTEDKAMKETLLLAIDSNSEIARELDMFLELGLVIQTSVFAKSSDIRENKDLMNRIGKEKQKELVNEPNIIIATNSQERIVRKFIADYLNQTVSQDLLELGDEKEINDNIINAVYEISSSLANTYIMSKDFKHKTTMYKMDEYQVLDRDFHQEIQHEYKEIIEEFAELINQENYETNDIDAMTKMIGKLKSIPDSIRKALVLNLQRTGTIFNDSSSDKFIDMIYDDTNDIDTFDKLKEEYYKAINNNKQFDADNVVIDRNKYNEILNTFITDEKVREVALADDNSHNNPLNYQRKTVYKEKNGMYYKTFEYIYIKNITTFANKSLCNQILQDNITKEGIISGLTNNVSINSIISTIEERQTQIGDTMFKLMNRDINLSNIKVDENIQKSLYSPVNYSKAVYYFYDLMPNGRVGMKSPGQVMDNKLIREISKQIIPNEIQVFENGKLVKKHNKANLPFNGEKNIPNTLESLLKVESKGFVFDNFNNNASKNMYLGILYSFARAFGRDVEKFELPNKTEEILKDIDSKEYENYYKLIAIKRNIQDKISALEGKLKNQNLSQTEIDSINKELQTNKNRLDNTEKNLKQITNQIDVTKFHYKYKGENLNELLADLTANRNDAVNRFKNLVKEIKAELKIKSYFSEHIGMALNNIEVFENAIKNGIFNLKDLQTQNLLVYIDGAATFMMENNVRGKSILPADAISGVFKYNDLVESSGIVDYILIRGHVNKLSQDLNISNEEAKRAYLNILEDKGIDIYTLSIGTTIMSLEPFNNISLLTNIFTNSSILSRDFMKKLIQPTAYNAGVRSRLEKLKEISQIPLDLALTYTTRSFIQNNLELIYKFNESKTNDEKVENLTQIREKFLKNIRDDINQLDNYIQQADKNKDNRLKQESIYKKEILEGLTFYLTKHPLTTLDNILSLNDNYVNVFSKMQKNSSISPDVAFDYNLLHSNISSMIDNEINTIVRYYENFDATHKLNRNNVSNGINILNTFNDTETIQNSDYITKGKANEILFRSLTEDMLFGENRDIELITVVSHTNKETGIKEFTVELTKDDTVIQNLKNRLSEIFKNSKIKLDDTEWQTIVLNVIEYYLDTDKKGFLPNHKPLALKANPVLVMTQQNNKRLVEQKNILQHRVNDMFVLSMIDIIQESLPKELKGKKIDLEQTYNQNKTFANRFNINKDNFITRLKEQFLSEAFYNNVYIPLFKNAPDSAQRAEYVNSMNEFFDSLTKRLEDENILNPMFKALATIDSQILDITKGKAKEVMVISSHEFIFPDVIGLFNHNLEGSVISYTNSPLFQIFDALVGNANNIEALRSDGWNGGFSQSHRATDSAFVMNRFMNRLPETFNNALKKSNIANIHIKNKYDLSSIEDIQIIMETLRMLELQIKSFVEISEFKQPIVKNIPSIIPSNEVENNQFDANLKSAYYKAIEDYKKLIDKLDDLEKQGDKNAKKAKEALQSNKDYNVLGEEEFNLYNVYKTSQSQDNLSKTLSRQYGNGLVEQALKFFFDTFKTDSIITRPKNTFLGKITQYVLKTIMNHNADKLGRTYRKFQEKSNKENLIATEVSTLLRTKIDMTNSNNKDNLIQIIKDIYGEEGNNYFNLFINNKEEIDIQELAEYVSINSIKNHLINEINQSALDEIQKNQVKEKIKKINNMNQLIINCIEDSKIIIEYGNNELTELKLPDNWKDTEEKIVLNAIENLDVFNNPLDTISKRIKQNANEGKDSYLAQIVSDPSKLHSYSSLLFNNQDKIYDIQFSNKLIELLERKNKIDTKQINHTINTVRENISINLGIKQDSNGNFAYSYNAHEDNNIYNVDGQTEYTAEQYLDMVNDDIDMMLEQESNINGQNISNELNDIKTMINDLSKNIRNNFKALDSHVNTQRKGNYSMEIDDNGNTITNTITIDSSANRYTRLHELFHALTSFGAIANNNRAKILLNKINQLRLRTKQYIDTNPSLITELELDYDHIFETEDVLKGTQEFLATFLSEPKLIAFLANLNTKDLNLQDNGKLEGKTLIGKGLNLVKSIIKYTTELIKHRFKAPQSALEVLTQATRELSSMNTQEGEKALKTEYENKITTRINRALVTRVANILSKDFGKFVDRNLEVLKPGETLEQAKIRFENEVMNDKNVSDTLKRLHKRIIDIKDKSPREKTIATAIYLLETAFFSKRKLRSFLRDNPVKIKYVREQLADLKHMLIEGTIFDIKVHLDFGLRPNDFLKNSINMVNRALSARNSINSEIEIAAINTKKMAEAYMFNTPEFNEYFKSKDKREQYSIGMFKLIVGQNLGDYFFNQDKISQTDLNDLFHYQFYAENDEIKSAINAHVNAGLDLMNVYDEKERKVVKRFIVDLAYTRITGKRNKFGNQNIELLFKQLNYKDSQYNADAMKHFHKAITLQAILTPKMMEDIGNEDIIHFNNQIQIVKNTFYENSDFQDSMKESFMNLVSLYKDMLQKVYTQKILDLDKAHNFYTDNRNKTELYFDEHRELYKNGSKFAYNSFDAYYDDAYQFLSYNQDIVNIAINPIDYGLGEEGEKAFKKAQEQYKKMGFKQIHTTDNGTIIYQYDGIIDYTQHKDRLGFMFRPLNHQGLAFYSMSEQDMSDEYLKQDIREHQQVITRNLLLDYGNEIQGTEILNTFPEFSSFSGLTEYKSLAGSETITRENISNKQFEEWVKPDLRLEKSFYQMAKISQENQIRDLNNNQIFYQIIKSDEYIKNHRIKDESKTNHYHHTEVLFYYDNGRFTFNKELTDKYGFSLSRLDEKDFAQMALAMNYDSMFKKGEKDSVYIDTRIMPMLFSFNKVHLGKMAGLINENFTKEKNPTMYKVLSGFQTILRGLIKETRNNTIIRNPNLVLVNFKSNILGLIGEGIPLKDIVQSLPFYIRELQKYHKDMKEKIRIENELVQLNKKEFRSNTNMTIEEQIDLKNKLKKEKEDINNAIARNSVTPLIEQGLYSNIIEDAETTGFKWDNWVAEKFGEKTGKDSYVDYVKEAFMTEDSDIYKLLAEWTRIGDFAPRAILYYHLIGKLGYSKEKALDEARERFINYNTPMFSPVMRALDYLGIVNYTKYKFNVQYQAIKAFANAPVQASTLLGLDTALKSIGIPKALTLDNYLAESFLIDGNVPSGFWNMGLDYLKGVWRWNYVTPVS